MRSFDAPRVRRVPPRWSGRSLEGEPVSGEFSSLALVIALKDSCDGCRRVLDAPIGAFGDVEVLLVVRDVVAEDWSSTAWRVVVAPELLSALDVRWPPFFALIDGRTQTLVSEGVVFDPVQVAEEIAPFLV